MSVRLELSCGHGKTVDQGRAVPRGQVSMCLVCTAESGIRTFTDVTDIREQPTA